MNNQMNQSAKFLNEKNIEELQRSLNTGQITLKRQPYCQLENSLGIFTYRIKWVSNQIGQKQMISLQLRSQCRFIMAQDQSTVTWQMFISGQCIKKGKAVQLQQLISTIKGVLKENKFKYDSVANNFTKTCEQIKRKMKKQLNQIKANRKRYEDPNKSRLIQNLRFSDEYSKLRLAQIEFNMGLGNLCDEIHHYITTINKNNIILKEYLKGFENQKSILYRTVNIHYVNKFKVKDIKVQMQEEIRKQKEVVDSLKIQDNIESLQIFLMEATQLKIKQNKLKHLSM